jgi:hypothetical protein
MIIKVKGSAVDVTTAVANSDTDTLGTFKMPAGGVEIIEKAATDTIASTATLSCTPVSYKA